MFIYFIIKFKLGLNGRYDALSLLFISCCNIVTISNLTTIDVFTLRANKHTEHLKSPLIF